MMSTGCHVHVGLALHAGAEGNTHHTNEQYPSSRGSSVI